MRRGISVALFAFASTVLPAVAPASPPASQDARLAVVKRELEATFAARMHAFEAKDYATLMAQVSPQYTAVRPDGTMMNRDDIAGYIRNNLDRWVRIVRQSNVIEGLRLDDKGNAVAEMRQNLARIQIVDGKEVLVESGVLQTETWTPSANGWQLLNVKDEREKKLSVDGKPRS